MAKTYPGKGPPLEDYSRAFLEEQRRLAEEHRLRRKASTADLAADLEARRRARGWEKADRQAQAGRQAREEASRRWLREIDEEYGRKRKEEDEELARQLKEIDERYAREQERRLRDEQARQ